MYENNQGNQGGSFQGNQGGSFQGNQGGNQTGYQQGRQQNNNQYNDQLTQVINYGFPFNHLLAVALMQRIPAVNLQRPDLKEKFFFFVTLAPGIGDGQNRTYDFQQGRVVMKFSTREISGLSEVLKQVAIGNPNVLPYTKFTKSQAGSKIFSIWTSQKQQQIGQNNVVINQINITISSVQKQTISLVSDQALGISKILDKMFDKAIELEFKLQIEAPTANTNTGGQFNSPNPNNNNSNQIPAYNNQSIPNTQGNQSNLNQNNFNQG